nr:MAG TPA: hypothetical protein [Caudoviricetes sp.]
MLVNGNVRLAGKAHAVSLNVGVALEIDRDRGGVVLGFRFVVQLDDRAGVAVSLTAGFSDLHNGDFLGRNNTAVGDHADLAGKNDTGLVLVGADEISVLAKLRDLLRMDKNDLLAVDLFLKKINGVNDAGILDRSGAAVIGELRPLKRGHGVVVYLGSNGLRKLVVGLADGIAVAGKDGFVRQLNGLHRLFDGDGRGGSGQLHGFCGNTFGNVGSVADVGVLRHGHGVAGNAYKRSVNLRKGRDNNLVGNFRGNHIRHDLRINQVRKFGGLVCHSLNHPLKLIFCKLCVCSGILVEQFQAFLIAHFGEVFLCHGITAALIVGQLVFDDLLVAGRFKLCRELRFQTGQLVIHALDFAVFVKRQLFRLVLLMQLERHIVRIDRLCVTKGKLDRVFKLRLFKLCLKLLHLLFIAGNLALQVLIVFRAFLQLGNKAVCGVKLCGFAVKKRLKSVILAFADILAASKVRKLDLLVLVGFVAVVGIDRRFELLVKLFAQNLFQKFHVFILPLPMFFSAVSPQTSACLSVRRKDDLERFKRRVQDYEKSSRSEFPNNCFNLFFGQPIRAFQVSFPTSPSERIFAAVWNDLTALSVFSPKLPSTSTDIPRKTRSVCRAFTESPVCPLFSRGRVTVQVSAAPLVGASAASPAAPGIFSTCPAWIRSEVSPFSVLISFQRVPSPS